MYDLRVLSAYEFTQKAAVSSVPDSNTVELGDNHNVPTVNYVFSAKS